ncbi:hypothetical protein ES705_11802 [subsurface metagenome]
MKTFFIFGKYSSAAFQGISPDRTKKAVDQIKRFNGEVTSMYALFGEQDLIIIADFPETAQAMKASIALSKLTGISFSTSEALPVEEFDKMISDV